MDPVAGSDVLGTAENVTRNDRRRRRYAGRLYRMPGPAETFWELAPARYRQLHQRAPRRPLHRTFRGLRYYAWSDPLAYLRGLGERRRLLRSASME